MDLMTWLRAEWDRVLGFTLIALGAVLLVLGYLGVSDSPYVAEQLSYIVSGGLGGLFLLGAGATLLILESVIPPGNEPYPGKFMDINMLVVTGGRERTEGEYRALLDRAGLRMTRIIPAHPLASIIEVKPT